MTGRNRLAVCLPTLALLLAFGVVACELDQDSLWYDEVWSLWASYSPLPETLNKVAADVHPPLYFALLNLWTKLTGESVYAARLLSTLAGLLGMAGTYAVGRTLFGRWTGGVAALLLGTSSFFVYYARETRMYTLLLSLAALSTLAYLRWLRRPTLTRLAFYVISTAALPYTHYYGPLITLAQGAHVALTRPRRLGGWLLAGGLGLTLYTPWLPVLLAQVQAHPGGPAALPAPTSWESVRWLIKLLLSDAEIPLLIPFLSGKALPRLRRHSRAVLLLILWLGLPPLIALAINAWIVPIYTPRYIIGILPAMSLLTAYGLRCVTWRPLAVALLLGAICLHLVSYDYLWPPKAPWKEAAARSVVETRRPGEPSLVMIASPRSLEAFYDHELGIRNAWTIDLSDRRHRLDEIREIVTSLDSEPAVWLMMPHEVGETWVALDALDAGRGIGHRNSAASMLFYRFDQGNDSDLEFYFGSKLRYEGNLFAAQPSRSPGERLCVDLILTTLAPLDGSYSYGVHLVDLGNVLVAQYDTGLGARAAGERIRLTPCLDLPGDVSTGNYYLQLVIYTWADVRRLPLIEGGSAGTPWGDALVFEALTVEPR